jgi:predicted anti-sigma-YlaC factor YlaD
MAHQHKSGIRRWLKGMMLRRMHRMITCKEFEEFVLSHLDGNLTRAQQAVFDLHLRLCRECREYLAAYQRSMEVGRAVLTTPDDRIPDDVPEDLIKAILVARKS